MTVFDNRVVTYSPAYTIVPTYECFNRCSYCNFRTEPTKSPWLTLAEAEGKLSKLQCQSVCEILILSGEVHPHSSRRKDWFRRIFELCELALSLGFLPHTNAGPLSYEEMAQLKEVNVSMGLMLEQLSPQLLQTVHRYAPSKIPEVRLQQLEWAGKLQIPFTSGLLLGIGETQEDWWETLEAIAKLHSSYGHIQEVILQPHSPGHQQSLDAPHFNLAQLPELIAQARQILPAEITIQIPPNLVIDSPKVGRGTAESAGTEAVPLLNCLEAGARDLGGIGPKDEVNPDYPHPNYHQLKEILAPAGWNLVPRLPIYPQYEAWLSQRLQIAVERWRKTLI
jgi:FO synthase subunit 1